MVDDGRMAAFTANFFRPRARGFAACAAHQTVTVTMQNHQTQYSDPNVLKPFPGNARAHSQKQIKQIARSIERFGFNAPVLIDATDTIIAGHGRVQAAKLLKLAVIPTIRLSHLSEVERRAYIIADNKLAQNATWNADLLAAEVQYLLDSSFEVELTGFEVAEIDLVLEDAAERKGTQPEPEDVLPGHESNAPAITRLGDRWTLGNHALACADAREPSSYPLLLQDAKADLVFTDPPYNVPIDGHVCGLGRVQHREFAMAAGEMSSVEFEAFLHTILVRAKENTHSGAIFFVCIDWRHVLELISAAARGELALKNICVWNKTNAGMGTFYRSKHELVFVFKNGSAPRVNNFELGQHGRYRTNVWDYAGVNTFRAGRDQELAMHPTVKPVALVADAIKDCSKRGDVVLDAFGGSGTTLIACEKTGRKARLLEFDPRYVDLIIRRWQLATGKTAVHESGVTFEELTERRTAQHVATEAAS
jgi:DNA modification methylase